MMNIVKVSLLAVVMLVSCHSLFADDQQNGQIGLDISNDKVDVLKSAIESGKLNPNRMPNGSLITPLGLAIENRSSRCIDYLLSLPSVNVHSTYYVIYASADGSKSNHNALYTAVKSGNVEVANRLLDMGVEADYLSEEYYSNGAFRGRTTTLVASMLMDETPESRELVQRLADSTKSINRTFAYDATPAERALMLPTVSLLYRLIGEAQESHAYHNAMIISLIERGAKTNTYINLSSGIDEAIKKYASAENYAAYQSVQRYIYDSPLLVAAQMGNHELMRYMIEECGVPYDRYDDKGAIVMSKCKTTACVEVLLNQGVDINTAYPVTGMPLLFTAITSENYELLEGLLKHGANPNPVVNGLTVDAIIRSYPKKRRKEVLAILERYR